jgi:hypothetical protein
MGNITQWAYRYVRHIKGFEVDDILTLSEDITVSDL